MKSFKDLNNKQKGLTLGLLFLIFSCLCCLSYQRYESLNSPVNVTYECCKYYVCEKYNETFDNIQMVVDSNTYCKNKNIIILKDEG